MGTVRNPNALLTSAYDLQSDALQPAYDRATRTLTRAYNSAAAQWSGALDALAILADEGVTRAELRTSAEYAEFRAALRTGLRQFSGHVQAVGIQMEQDGITKGERVAYDTLALTDKPQRVNVDGVERITTKAHYPLRIAQDVVEGNLARLDATFTVAEQGYSAQWVVERLAAYFERQPVIAALAFVRTIQMIMARRVATIVQAGQR